MTSRRRLWVRRSVRLSVRAFTLVELLVVISIIVILIALAVPAFGTLLYNSERSLAENQLRIGLSAGRDAAIRSDGGDGAAFFTFLPGGRVSIIPCIHVGRIDDRDLDNGAAGTRPSVMRDVFVPIAAVEPVSIPRGWSVRAFTPPGTITNGSTDRNGWYESAQSQAAKGGWVFPETDFVNLEQGSLERVGFYRQSFIVRFQAGTGTLDTSHRETAIVLNPLNVDTFRTAVPFNTDRGTRADLSSDRPAFVRRVLARPDLSLTEKRQLLGDQSVDCVLVRAVAELALYEEQRMMGSLGGKVNRDTGTWYLPPGATANGPTIDTAALPTGMNANAAMVATGEWLRGQYRRNGELVPSDARIFTVQRYLGQMQEITP